ncbi:hypothetical protein FKG94_08740 [Exilibacterium tricleocarpae]|uniref:Uncharacterized protein n=1 Tax=Exilibacterium tricleocarpae TaxID=2591008 RepID=A0A545TVE3_9GAMM|nr:AHH domain-containing protein [Exilibacterium tricleocarpae]TQV81183.1 hypothetical protein FKG94_08740 [Exilibacterium tricleocarpae]
MPIPAYTLKAYEKTRVDLAIEHFSTLENPTLSDLNVVRIQASVQDGIDSYRVCAVDMTETDLENEGHSSKRMAGYMEASGDTRPCSSCDCHAMVSGKHKLAAPMRAVMAWCLMRIDDPRNGCWLPRTYDTRRYMPKWLSEAVPHQGLHNPRYYAWLEKYINVQVINGLDDLIVALRQVRTFLQSGALPPEAWPKRKVA